MKYALLALTLAGAWWYYATDTVEFVPEVRTVEITRGDIVESVSATGSLEAVTTVQIGSQESGIIQELRADFNSIVRSDDVIARLAPSLFETQIEQARANLRHRSRIIGEDDVMDRPPLPQVVVPNRDACVSVPFKEWKRGRRKRFAK